MTAVEAKEISFLFLIGLAVAALSLAAYLQNKKNPSWAGGRSQTFKWILIVFGLFIIIAVIFNVVDKFIL